MPSTYPSVQWHATRATFVETPAVTEQEQQLPTGAALVFVFYDKQILLANIAGRGWTIPGGRCNPDEPAADTAIREAYEETGARIVDPVQIGAYILDPISVRDTRTRRQVPLFIAGARAIAPLPPGFESLGVRLALLEELPEIYYMWDELLESVCAFAIECARQRGIYN